jgi:hypothetical protein
MTWLLTLFSMLTGLRTTLFVGAGMGVIAAFLYGQHKGDTQCKASYELALAKEQIADLQRQKNALENNLERMNEIEAKYLREQAEDAEYIEDLNEIISKRAATDNSCPIAATADELRRIERIGKDR